VPPDYSPHESWFRDRILPHEATLKAWLHSRFGAAREVDDIVQEAYLRVLKFKEKGEIVSPKAFLFATARNIAVSLVRKAEVRGEKDLAYLDDLDVLDEGESIIETVARNQEMEILTRAIQSLPERCRRIFTLRKVYGLSQQEIARQLNISTHTVNAQIMIGIRKCLAFVERYRREAQA